MRWPSWLRCREAVTPALTDDPVHRCRRLRWHRGTHFAPYGHAWEGRR